MPWSRSSLESSVALLKTPRGPTRVPALGKPNPIHIIPRVFKLFLSLPFYTKHLPNYTPSSSHFMSHISVYHSAPNLEREVVTHTHTIYKSVGKTTVLVSPVNQQRRCQPQADVPCGLSTVTVLLPTQICMLKHYCCLGDLRFSKRYCWRFESSALSRLVNGCRAFVFRVKQVDYLAL